MHLSFREITLYRYRTIIGAVVFTLLLIGLLLVQITDIPRGLSAGEQAAAVQSVTLNVLSSPPEAVIDAPYHLLQKASVYLLGLSALSIKLPSVIMGLLLAAGMVVLLKRFFKLSATMVTALLMISSLPFLTMGRTGTPLIMLSVLTVVLMIAGAGILARPRFALPWKALAAFVAVSLLYTPLGIYPLLAFVLAALFHPHLRYHLTHTKPLHWAVLGALSLVALTPLVLALIRQPQIALELAGLPNQMPGWTNISANLSQLGGQFFQLGEPSFGIVAAPLFGMPLLILMILGVLQLIKDRHSARAYVLLGWIGFFLLVLSFDPSHVLNLFVPIVLLLAVGIEALLREWYSLFPRNPYARIAALVPLGVLVFGIGSSEISRYFDGYRYSTRVEVAAFDPTLRPLKQQLEERSLSEARRVYLAVDQQHRSFYDLLRREYPNLQVVSRPAALAAGEFNVVLDGVEAELEPKTHGKLSDFAVSASRQQPLLFQVYRSS